MKPPWRLAQRRKSGGSSQSLVCLSQERKESFDLMGEGDLEKRKCEIARNRKESD